MAILLFGIRESLRRTERRRFTQNASDKTSLCNRQIHVRRNCSEVCAHDEEICRGNNDCIRVSIETLATTRTDGLREDEESGDEEKESDQKNDDEVGESCKRYSEAGAPHRRPAA